MRRTAEKIAKALGKEPADLLIKNARLVNVVSGEIHEADVAIDDGRILGYGDYQAKKVLDIDGAYLAPSLIDGHFHIESTMLTPYEFARVAVPHGTGAVIADPHEFANVLGLKGIEFVLHQENLPLDIFVALSSCVPATKFEESFKPLSVNDLATLIDEPRVVGIAEVMNYHGVLGADPEVLAKIALGESKKIVDGHAPELTGKELNAYILAGIHTDHESTTFAEAQEKLRKGMHIHLREGSSEKNLRTLLPLVKALNNENFSFVTDDRHPLDLFKDGHIDVNVRIALELGMDIMTAIKIATINTARFYRLRNIGAIAPRYWADMIIFEDVKDFRPQLVFKKGKLVAKNGKMIEDQEKPALSEYENILGRSMHVKQFTADDFKIKAAGTKINIIEIVPDQIITRKIIDAAKIENGFAIADPVRNIAKLLVIERHHALPEIGKAFAKGFGLQRGACATSVAHDSHNLVVLGMNDADMYLAAKRAIEIGGGQVVVLDGKVIAEIALPYAGLVSDEPLETVVVALAKVYSAFSQLGCTRSDIFATLSFISLSVIPELRLTTKGLVDVQQFKLIDLFVD
jgi:adenine deaminase